MDFIKKWKKELLLISFLIILFMIVSSLASFIFIKLLGVSIGFNPFNIYKYLNAYPENETVIKFAKSSFFVSILILIALIFLSYFAFKKKQKLHGDAKLASFTEMIKKGLLPKLKDRGNGLIIGKVRRNIFSAFQYLFFKGAQFAIVIAPTRSGKGVGFVIPNLYTYPNSAVVLDIKQENWDLTSKYRAEVLKNECFLFNPMCVDFKSHKYNPLDAISKDPLFRVHDVQKIGQMLYPIPKDGDDIFMSTARNLFNGIVLMLIETGQEVNLGNVLDQVTEGDGQEYLGNIIKAQEAKGEPLSDFCVRALNSYVSMASDNTRAGCIGNFRTALSLWNNPLVREVTSSSDFSFDDLRKKKMSIYIGVTPDNLDDLQPLLNLFFQQLINMNLKELPEQNPELKHDVLLLMDEFTALGRIPVLMKGVAYIAGYGLRLVPIVQDVDQIRSVYGDREAKNFINNIACYIAFPPSKKDVESAESLSKSLGYVTVKSQSRDIRKRSQGSESDHQRALFLPQEVTSIGEDKAIIIVDNMNPIISNRLRYFEEDFFLEKFSKISGKNVKGMEIKELAQKGYYSAEIPTLEIARKNEEKKENTSPYISKYLAELIGTTKGVLNAFNLKEFLIKKYKSIDIDSKDKESVLRYIDGMVRDSLYKENI